MHWLKRKLQVWLEIDAVARNCGNINDRLVQNQSKEIFEQRNGEKLKARKWLAEKTLIGSGSLLLLCLTSLLASVEEVLSQNAIIMLKVEAIAFLLITMFVAAFFFVHYSGD